MRKNPIEVEAVRSSDRCFQDSLRRLSARPQSLRIFLLRRDSKEGGEVFEKGVVPAGALAFGFVALV
jgi:hypothetical protein